MRISPRVIVIGVLLLIAAALFVRPPRFFGYAPDWLVSLQAQFVRVGVGVRTWTHGIGAAARAVDRVHVLEEENRAFRARIAALEHAITSERALAAIATTFNAQWGKPVPARIIAGTFTPTHEELLVDRGMRDSIRVGDPVVLDGALIGIVRITGGRRSTIQLLADPSTRIGTALAGNPSAIGILEADPGGGIILTRIPRDRDVSVGATIVTATVNAGIPSGIPIGTIAAIEDDADGFFRHAVVIPLGDPKSVFGITILRQDERML